MKRILLLLLITLTFAFDGFAQNGQIVRSDRFKDITAPLDQKFNQNNLSRFDLRTNASNKKASVSQWYGFVNALGNNSIQVKFITNSTLFPDSNVLQLYGSPDGGVELGNVNLYSIGQVFDPKSIIFENDRLSQYNTYTIDTVALAYNYSHNIPGTVDTVIIQFLAQDKDASSANNQIDTGKFNSPGQTTDGYEFATAYYSSSKNKALRYEDEVKIPIGEADTIWSSSPVRFNYLAAAPTTPILVPANSLCGMVATFKPGFTWNKGDTIQQDWAERSGNSNEEVVNKLNHFRVFAVQEDQKVKLSSKSDYNMGLTRSKAFKFWTNEYIPGTAWFDYNLHYQVLFHISADNVGIDERSGALNIPVAVYPNPVLSGDNVNFEFELKESQNLQFEVLNAIGENVNSATEKTYNSGRNTFSINTSDLKAGLYFVKISGKNGIVTKQFLVR